MDCLYHYCANETCFSILKGHNIRMSNISKSNDSLELQLFFPDLHREIIKQYEEKPFPFQYEGLNDKEAMRELVQSSERKWAKYLQDGKFNNFVVCFSEEKDCLSQWRGYADDGKGCCIGFSKDLLLEYCNKSNGVLRMERVEYVSQEEISEKITCYAANILGILAKVRDWTLQHLDHTYMYVSIGFTLDRLLENAFTDSLCLKTKPFYEEKEWRIFITYDTYLNHSWIPNIVDGEDGSATFFSSMEFIQNHVDFRIISDDLVPFCPIEFKDFSEDPIVEIWLGPKNHTREKDLWLFLIKNGYYRNSIKKSIITYR